MKARTDFKIILTRSGMTVDGAVGFDEFLHTAINAILTVMQNMVTDAEKEEDVDTTELKEALYDTFNIAVSNALEVFIPDKLLRPDLTAEAILNAENDILSGKLDAGDKEGFLKLVQPSDTASAEKV